ncbi:DUF559 domain-containing protein [Raoultibacter phocaeensis]|uniref:DUF559 domain-containing protein n=1 Tax=Raoultibacter phocaeensis TaxID=2479841 RepID=UPI0015D588C9|nr:DUF559 domain-containing protein [Raoultibacter phocaeensis]
MPALSSHATTPDSASRASLDSRIYFGYKTALQILRTVDVRTLAPARIATQSLPDRGLCKRQIENAIGGTESAYPGLSIERPAHVLVGSSSRCRASSAYKLHVCTSRLAGTSFYRLENDVCISAPALAFIHQAAQRNDLIFLLQLGYELCGTYQSWLTGVPTRYQVKPLASVRALRCYVSKNPSLKGARKAQHAIRYLADGSASPRETKQAIVFGLPMRYGGYGLGIPRMNYEVHANKAARAISGKSSFRCDLCWPEHKLDVEYQSRECHEGEESRLADSRRTNALMAMGWTVVGITNDELDSFAATETIAQTLRRHLGKRSQPRVSDYHARKLKLRRQLGLSVGYE